MKRAVAVFIAGLIMISSAGCTEIEGKPSSVQNAELTSEGMESPSAEVESAEISMEISTEESCEDIPISVETTEPMETIETVETAETAEVYQPVQQEYPKPVTYSAPEEGNVFVDFEYIENVHGVPESELHPYVYEQARRELEEQERYIKECKNVLSLKGVDLGDYLAEDGTIVPKLFQAVFGDFDGNGGDDYFVLLTSPCESSFADRVSELYWLLWVNDNGWVHYVDVFRDSVTEVSVLDYGICQQLIVCNNGTIGAGCSSGIYGIRDGNAVCHYSFRGNFTKVECFINASGWQGSGDFMYYDTVAEEYRCILPDKVIPFAELLEMDKTGSLADYKEDWDGAASWPIGQLMCGKFWCISFGPMHHGGEPYLYENGGFVYCYEQYPVRASEEGFYNCVSDGIDYDIAVATMLSPEAADKRRIEMNTPKLSDGQVFVHFDYIKDIKGIQDISAHSLWVDKAVSALKKHEDYLAFNDMLKAEDMTNFEFRYSNIDMDITDYLDENGDIKPMFNTAYIDDYDNDGRDEGFFLLDLPYNTEYSTNQWIVRSYLVYASGKDTSAEVLTDYAYGTIYETSMLDYGLCRQLIFCSSGTMGADSHSELFGVAEGKPVQLYGLRGGFCKVDCFLAANGWQGMGDFMYYDTVEHIYKPVPSSKLSAKEVLAMDSTGVFTDVYQRSAPLPWFMLVGNKYYCLWWGSYADRAYLYENGAFVQCNDSQYIRYSSLLVEGGNTFSADVAIASMISPEKAAESRETWHVDNYLDELTEVSSENVFIDYDYISEYEGITDVSMLGDKEQTARAALLRHEDYIEISSLLTPDKADQLSIHEGDPAAKEFFDEGGKVQPLFYRAFCEDFDGDGKSEVFVVYRMPVKSGGGFHLRYYLILVNSNCKAEVVNNYYTFDPALLDYGAFRQLAIIGYGICGADSQSSVYGVVDGSAKLLCELRGDYSKWKCFLVADGWQACGGCMYYDTVAEEYRYVVGDLVPINDIIAMDKTEVLAEYTKTEYTVFPPEVSLIGGKYYVAWSGLMDSGRVFTYENGEFVSAGSDCRIRLPGGVVEVEKGVKIKDIDAAIASMISPKEAFLTENPIPESLYAENRISEADKEVLVEISEDHAFVDYDLHEDYKGVTDATKCGKALDAAIALLKQQDFYTRTVSAVTPEKEVEQYYDEKPDVSIYFDENGVLTPRLHEAFIDDFDGDGRTEQFIILGLPAYYYENDSYRLRYNPVFVDSYGNAQLISYGHTGYTAALLDFGAFRQLLIEGFGMFGTECHSTLLGVVKGKLKIHIDARLNFEKWECFLSTYGMFATGCTMYYDTAAQEWRKIIGEYLDPAKVFYIDRENVLPRGMQPSVTLMGGKYYVVCEGVMDEGTVYTCENGVFVPVSEDYGIRSDRNVYIYGFSAVLIEDIDEVLKTMLTPEQAAVQLKYQPIPSEGHIFVDYTYIEDYKGTTDPTACGKWLDKAMAAVRASDIYKEKNDELKAADLSALKFKYTELDIHEYIDENGDIVPVFSEAYIEDFDGDGRKECFIKINIPQLVPRMDEWLFYAVFVFCGEEYQLMEEPSGYSLGSAVAILDYGICKQLVVEIGDQPGFPSYRLRIYGIKDGRAESLFGVYRGELIKQDCFLAYRGYQGVEGFLYYDTVRGEYLPVPGREISTETAKVMDSTGVLSQDYDCIILVAEKYYFCMSGGTVNGIYTYENGVFVPCADMEIFPSEGEGYLIYDEAVSSMLTPEQAETVNKE